MPSIKRLAFVTSSLAIFVCSQFVAGQRAETQINSSSLRAEIIVNRVNYELDPAISGEDFFKYASDNTLQSLPDPPTVDLTLRLYNSNITDVMLAIGGDESEIGLQLNGPGALNVASRRPMTADLRIRLPVNFKSKSYLDIPITSLASGARNKTDFSYWTKTGEFTLKATVLCIVDGKKTKLETESVELKVLDTNSTNSKFQPFSKDRASTLTAGMSIASALSILDDACYSVKGGGQMENKGLTAKIAWRKISDGIEVAIYYNELSKKVTNIAMVYRPHRTDLRGNYQFVGADAITFNPDGTYNVKFKKPIPMNSK